jgi:hypothetical protein
MTFDLNDAMPATTGTLIPDGTFAKLAMVIRPGGSDGENEIDRGLLKRSGNPDSDVVMLDCEFTVTEGPYTRRKVWQCLTVSGGKLDADGVSIGAGITKSTLRGILDSAQGLNPADMSEPARAKRILRGFADLNGIEFVAKIKIEASRNAAYADRNRLDRAVVPTEPEWRKVMNGETLAAQPRSRASVPAAWEAPAQGVEPPASLRVNEGRVPAQELGVKPALPGPAWLKG